MRGIRMSTQSTQSAIRAARARRRAFTIIEVMIVVAIVLALAGIVGVSVLGRREEAKRSLGETDFNTIKNALRLFRLDFDRYPTDEEGVTVLWDKSKLDPEADSAKWKKFLDEPMLNDRWGQPWGYRQVSTESGDESTFDLWSNGPDKQEGTEDDITSWAAARAAEESSGASGTSGTTPKAGG